MTLDVDVLIVGAGPTGMVAATFLDRLGMSNVVVERRDGPIRAPAAHVINARTFEVLRAAGVDMAEVAAASQDPADAGTVYWTSSLTGEVFGSLPFERQLDDQYAVTPTPLRNLPQDSFERILSEHLDANGHRPRYGCEWQSSVQHQTGVDSVVRAADGSMFPVRSRWVIAADGAASGVRKAAGIEMLGPPRIASMVMIHFTADWRTLVADRPGVLYFVESPTSSGVFISHGNSSWVYMHGWDPDAEPVEAFTTERCADVLRHAVGSPTADFRIERVAPWHMSMQIAERYRAGRFFLVGDAAHRFPPTGGLGLNTGVQDAHNLVWKLAFVERGLAADALLDTYGTERQPVAQANADASGRNAMRMAEVPQALGPDHQGDRAAVRAAVDNQSEHFDMPGLQLGFSYDNGAVVGDGSDLAVVDNPVREFVPTGRPGARLPHCWTAQGCNQGEQMVSALDLLPCDQFALVVGRRAGTWADAVDGLPIPVKVITIGPDVADTDGAWASTLGIGDEGAVLVRPDQHIAWRATTSADDPALVLSSVLHTILGR